MNIKKRLKNGEQDQILNGLVKTFQSKTDNFFTRDNMLQFMAKQQQLKTSKFEWTLDNIKTEKSISAPIWAC